MKTLEQKFRLPVGYSDHTVGIEIAVAAVALGAMMIEKHLTLDRKMPGPDHKASIEPSVFKKMVTAIRHVESSLGNGEKRPAECELKNIVIARKSIVAARDIKSGEILTREHLAIKRPGNGISPKEIVNVVGMKAKIDIRQDDIVMWEQLK
jgi:sialic acid synthase SpsE